LNWTNTILYENVDAGLKMLPDDLVQTIVTSPPYFGLRDYSGITQDWPEITYKPVWYLDHHIKVPAINCQLGQEAHPTYFIGHLVYIFREAKRVLKDDGTLWLNIADSFSAGGLGYSYQTLHASPKLYTKSHSYKKAPKGLNNKNLIGIPWMIAQALQADGWYLRSDVIWSKPNPMPESVKDRPTRAHEYVFLLSKHPNYFDKQKSKMKKIFIVAVFFKALVFFLLFYLATAIYNDVQDSGGIGYGIGKFMNEIDKGRTESDTTSFKPQ